MKETRGFWDLAFRPAAIWAGYIAVLPAFAVASDALSKLPAIESMGQTDVTSRIISAALWRETILIPFAFAMCAAAVISPVRGGVLGWSIPALRSQLATAALYLLIASAVIVGFLHWGFNGTAIVGTAFAALTFAVIVSWGSGARGLRMIAIVLTIMVARPSLVMPLTRGALGLLLAAAAGAYSAWLMSRMYSPDVHRAQALPGSLFEDDSPRPWWAMLSGGEKEDAPPASTSSGLLRWLRLAHYAKYPTRWGFVEGQLFVASFYSLWAYADNSLYFVVTMAVISSASLGLPGRSTYPVSRKTRASVAFIEHLQAAVVYCVLCGILLYVLFALHPFPQFLADERPDRSPGIVVSMAIVAIFLPMARWHAACPPQVTQVNDPQGARSEGYVPRFILSAILYTISALAFRFWYELHEYQLNAARAALLLAGMFAFTHLIYFVALRRVYSTRDLA